MTEGAWVQALLLLVAAGTALAAQSPASESGARPPEAPRNASDLHLEWRMEATSHIASLAIRGMHCKLDPAKPCDLPDSVKVTSLRDWAVKDPGWERVLSSLSLYELSRRFWQQQDYPRSLVAVEQAIALKLFPYRDADMLGRWQRSLVQPGPAFKRPKLELADALILKANGMYEVGRREKNLEHLHQALEAIHLSAALMQTSKDVVPEVLKHLATLSAHVGMTATDILQQMSVQQLQTLMERYAIKCPECVHKVDYVKELVACFALPVEVVAQPSGGITVLEQPFVHSAYTMQPYESKRDYMQRFAAQLVGMVHKHFLRDMGVPCTLQKPDTKECLSYLPAWVLADNTEQWGDREKQSLQGAAAKPASKAVPPAPDTATGGSLPLPPESASKADLSPSLRVRLTTSLGQPPLNIILPPARVTSESHGGVIKISVTDPVTGVAEEVHVASALKGAPPLPWDAGQFNLADRIRNQSAGSLNALIDRWMREGVPKESQLLMFNLNSPRQNANGTNGTATNSSTAAANSSAAGGMGGTQSVSNGATRKAAGRAGTAVSGGQLVHEEVPFTAEELELSESFYRCLANTMQHPGTCLPLLEKLTTRNAPPTSHPSQRNTSGPPPPSRLVPLRPLKYRPAPPPLDHCCPVYRRKLGDPPSSSKQTTPISTAVTNTQQSLASAWQVPMRVPEPHKGYLPEVAPPSGNGLRQAVDRQLREQLDRVTRGHSHTQDDPIVILTLSGATLGAILAVSFARHRKRVVRFILERRSAFQLQLSLLTSRQPAKPAATAEEAATPTAAAAPASQAGLRRRQVGSKRGNPAVQQRGPLSGGAATLSASWAPWSSLGVGFQQDRAAAGAHATHHTAAVRRKGSHGAVSGGGTRRTGTTATDLAPAPPGSCPSTRCSVASSSQGGRCDEDQQLDIPGSNPFSSLLWYLSAPFRGRASESDAEDYQAMLEGGLDDSSQPHSRPLQRGHASAGGVGAHDVDASPPCPRRATWTATQASHCTSTTAFQQEDCSDSVSSYSQSLDPSEPPPGDTSGSELLQHTPVKQPHAATAHAHAANPGASPRTQPVSSAHQHAGFEDELQADDDDDGWQQLVSRPRRSRAAGTKTPAAQTQSPAASKPAASPVAVTRVVTGSVMGSVIRPGRPPVCPPPANSGPPAVPATTLAPPPTAWQQPLLAAQPPAPAAPAAPAASMRRSLSRSGGWLDWLSSSVLSSSPSTSGTIPLPAAQPHTLPMAPAAQVKNKTSGDGTHSDASLLQHASPIRTAQQPSRYAPIPGPEVLPPIEGTSPATRGGFMSALSSLIGYAPVPSNSIHHTNPALASGYTNPYNSAAASTTHSSAGSPLPVSQPDLVRPAPPPHSRQSLLDLLPASLCDPSPVPSPAGPAPPAPSSRPLNPSAPSFRSLRTPAVPASTTNSAATPAIHTLGNGQNVVIPPLPANTVCTNLTGLHPSPFHVAAAAATQRLRGDPFGQPLSSRADPFAFPLSARKSQNPPAANIQATAAAPARFLPEGFSNAPGPSMWNSTNTAAASGAGYTPSNDGTALVQPFAGGFTAASVASGSSTPHSALHTQLPDSLMPGTITPTSTAPSGPVYHQSLPEDTTPAPVITGSGLGTSSVSLPSALQGFSMFPGSVWSPSAVAADGQAGGWGTAKPADAANTAALAGWGAPLPGSGFSAGLGGMHGASGLPVTLGGAPLLDPMGSNVSLEDLQRLGEELQANDLAQDILRTVVEG